MMRLILNILVWLWISSKSDEYTFHDFKLAFLVPDVFGIILKVYIDELQYTNSIVWALRIGQNFLSAAVIQYFVLTKCSP